MVPPRAPPPRVKPSTDPLFSPWFFESDPFPVMVDVGPDGVRVRATRRRPPPDGAAGPGVRL